MFGESAEIKKVRRNRYDIIVTCKCIYYPSTALMFLVPVLAESQNNHILFHKIYSQKYIIF